MSIRYDTPYLQTNKSSHSYVISLFFLGIKKNCLIFSCAAHHTLIWKTNAKLLRIIDNIYPSKLNNRFDETHCIEFFPATS